MLQSAPVMNPRSLLLVVVSLLALAGCRGPKGSPESSVKSFFSAAVAEDFDAMAETLSADSRKKLGANAAAKLGGMFSGWEDADIDIEDYSIDVSGQSATVRFKCLGTSLVNYKARQFDCSDTLQLVKEEDDKWHVVLSGGRTLSPM